MKIEDVREAIYGCVGYADVWLHVVPEECPDCIDTTLFPRSESNVPLSTAPLSAPSHAIHVNNAA